MDQNIEKSQKKYEKFKILTTVGYSSYSNSQNIYAEFYRDKPYESIEDTIYKQIFESTIKPNKKPTLLYLKSSAETDASIKLSRKVTNSKISEIVDDPQEVSIQTLSWYAEQLNTAFGVITHFLSQEHRGSNFHNAKISFISGIAYGFGKELLMLAHDPFESPIDYRDFLKTHKTAQECEQQAINWLEQVEIKYSEKLDREQEYHQRLKSQNELQEIKIGDYVAENESEKLLEYFIETDSYRTALNSKHLILIGRKGSGKTAILYKLQNQIESDVRNHVCLIKPIAYQLDGILRMLAQELPISERGYLIGSFWKFLIYTELAQSVYKAIKNKGIHYDRTQEEDELWNFIEENNDIILNDFSMRLDSVVAMSHNISDVESATKQRTKISELLHRNVISKLRTLLGNVLKSKEKVSIIIDNLDQNWNPKSSNLKQLAELLLGLLEVSKDISNDFSKSNHWRSAINLSLIIFLRSDIFSQIIKYEKEPDKIVYRRVLWDDDELLLRVIEERFITSLEDPSEIWSKYFCATVKGIPTKDYLVQNILPRPRDLIYFSKEALSNAINRGHTQITEKDVLKAQKTYSHYALTTLLAESNINDLEELLYEFIGKKEVVTLDDVLEGADQIGIDTHDLDEIIDQLCDLTFLGREIKEGDFRFQYNDENKNKFQVMARKTADKNSNIKRFKINKAFHPYLEIEVSEEE
jgi:predicted AAA+ superfamily ATPase